jgi:hypothetical protein
MTKVHARRALFGEKERLFLETDGVEVSLFRYDTGIEAVRLANSRGYVIVLPYLGQMVWDANFEGVRLGMGHKFPAPRPAKVIVDTYGCLAFHSGLLRNGCPSPQDDHQLHGEFSCATLNRAALELGTDEDGAFVRLTGEYEYIAGFGPHYMARPSVTLRADRTVFDLGMSAENRGGKAMDLMYMCHINFAFVEGGHIVQAAPYTPENVAVRTAIPGHVRPTPEYRALLEELARNPGRMECLDPSLSYDPEQVFYLYNLRRDGAGRTHVMLRRPEGDGFVVSFFPDEFPYPARWLLRNADQQVAAIALPSTCHPEGYLAEHRAGHVRSVPPGGSVSFRVRVGYLDSAGAESLDASMGSFDR